MTDRVKCTNCGSAQMSVQKKGFSIKKSAYGLIFATVLSGIVWAVLITQQNSENRISDEADKVTHIRELSARFDGTVYTPVDYTGNKALWTGTVFFLAISILYGLSGASENQIVCLNCGNVQPIKNEAVAPHFKNLPA